MTDQHNDLREEDKKITDFVNSEMIGWAIEKYVKKQKDLLKPSIEHFLESGNVTGNLRIELKEMLKEFAQSQLSEAHKEIEELNDLQQNMCKTIESLQSDLEKAQARIKELEVPKRWVSDEEIEQMAFEKFGHNSSSESYKNWVIGAKDPRDKLSPHTGGGEAELKKENAVLKRAIESWKKEQEIDQEHIKDLKAELHTEVCRREALTKVHFDERAKFEKEIEELKQNKDLIEEETKEVEAAEKRMELVSSFIEHCKEEGIEIPDKHFESFFGA